MIKTIGYAAKSATSPLEVYTFERRELQDHDVQIEFSIAGSVTVISIGRGTSGIQRYIRLFLDTKSLDELLLLGHGVISFKVGDVVALSAIVDSCGICHEYQNHQSNIARRGLLSFVIALINIPKGLRMVGFQNR